MPTMNKTGYHVDHDHPGSIVASHVGYEALRWRVPADDTHTIHVTVLFAPFVDGKAAELRPDGQDKGIVESPYGVYSWDETTNHLGRNDQDRAAQESQGEICDRTMEHLGSSDEGVILLRKIYREAWKRRARAATPAASCATPSRTA